MIPKCKMKMAERLEKDLIKKAELSVKELKETAQKTDNKLSSESIKRLTEFNDKCNVEKNLTWSILGYQIVGAEKY